MIKVFKWSFIMVKKLFLFLFLSIFFVNQLVAMNDKKIVAFHPPMRRITPETNQKIKGMVIDYQLFHEVTAPSKENQKLFDEVKYKMGATDWYIHLFQKDIEDTSCYSKILNYGGSDTFNSNNPNIGIVVYDPSKLNYLPFSMRKAIFAHECAHILLKHQIARTKREELKLSQEEKYVICRQEEKEADVEACSLTGFTKELILYFDLKILTGQKTPKGQKHPSESERINYLLPIAKSQGINIDWLHDKKRRIAICYDILSNSTQKDNGHALYLLSKLLKKNKKQSINCLTLAANKKYIKAMDLLGNNFYIQGKYADAKEMLLGAKSVSFKDKTSLSMLADIYKKEGKDKESKQYLDMALKLVQDNEDDMFELINCLVHTIKNYKKAKQLLQPFIDKNHGEAFYMLGGIYILEGNKNEGLKCLYYSAQYGYKQAQDNLSLNFL